MARTRAGRPRLPAQRDGKRDGEEGDSRLESGNRGTCRVQDAETDNGPEFTSRHFDHRAHANRINLDFISPEGRCRMALWSFNGRLLDECLQISWFTSIEEARQQVETWRLDYNKTRPHSALGHLAPANTWRG